MIQIWRQNWPNYLIEAWGLGLFMVSAVGFTILIEGPGWPIREHLSNPLLRRVLMGLAMGGTAIGIIYSGWGKKSGAHLNPAVTLANLFLYRIAPADALGYMVAQFTGGALGVQLVKWLASPLAAQPEVNYAATVPGAAGVGVALALEGLIAFVLFYTVLQVSNHRRLAPYTGWFAGALVALYITFEAPYSGMSMNPARTVASALASGTWTGWYIYFLAPLAGMLGAAWLYRLQYRRRHGGNCLTLNCHMSGAVANNRVYQIRGPQAIIAQFGLPTEIEKKAS